MIPNFEPKQILPKLASLVRPKDFLLFSANLAPGKDYAAGVKRVLPQYDNPLTRDWLMTFLIDLGIERNNGKLRFKIETDSASGLKRIVAGFHFTRSCRIEVESEVFDFRAGEAIRLFFSYRYTPGRVHKALAGHGLEVCEQWIAKSEEEGVFLCRKKSKCGASVLASRLVVASPHRSKNPQRIQHGFDARDFVGAEQVGFTQRGQHGKERFSAADFVAEKFEGVGQGMADWKTERPESERVQEDIHLMPHANGTVLQIAVVKWIATFKTLGVVWSSSNITCAPMAAMRFGYLTPSPQRATSSS